MERIYLDNAATTQLDPQVLEAMLPHLKEKYGNASAAHSFGFEARQAIDTAREQLAGFLYCAPSEVLFTGTATEANNMALRGVLQSGDHVIVSAIEHDSVLETVQELERDGIDVTRVSVDKDGFVRVEGVVAAVKPETKLVSVMYANNEIGTIQPIADIAAAVRGERKDLLVHTDAVQAANYLDCNVETLGVDMLTMSSHKIYGPKGVGCLYVKSSVQLQPHTTGGGQEAGKRSGTENVAGIVGMGQAVALLAEQKDYAELQKLRDQLTKAALDIEGASLNGAADSRLPNNVNISFKNIEAEVLIAALNDASIAVSSGSACAVKKPTPSHVLTALGLQKKEALGSVRFSLGRFTTQAEIDRVCQVLPQLVANLRKL